MSKKLLNEQQVLKELGVKDFRHVSKDKLMKFASMLGDMDPEVAKKALDQFPECAKTASEIVARYKDVAEKGITANEESEKEFYSACNRILDSLEKDLDRGGLTFEERNKITDKMIDVAERMSAKDQESKDFIRQVVFSVAGVAALGILTLGSVLGGNAEIHLPGNGSV